MVPVLLACILVQIALTTLKMGLNFALHVPCITLLAKGIAFLISNLFVQFPTDSMALMLAKHAILDIF
jgi:hypothetical protein